MQEWWHFMATRFSDEQLNQLREDARLLALRAGEHESEFQHLIASAEQDVRAAQAALDAPRSLCEPSMDALIAAIRSQMGQRLRSIEDAQRLGRQAHRSHIAADRLVGDLAQDRLDRRAAAGLARHAVLVVDDYEDSREWLEMVLCGAGFVVHTACNGLEAVLAAHDLQPAVILMDITMPVLDGVQATKLIKEIDTARDARVIAYTAATPRNEQVGSPLFAAVLQKPAPPDVVVAVVQRLALRT
jgi:CheY-like chemotaxis protein